MKRRGRPPDFDEIVPESDYEDALLPANTVLIEEHLTNITVCDDKDEEAKEEKTVRADVEARWKLNATTNFTTVKTTFNSFVTERGKALPWDEVLTDMNKAVTEAYVLANLHAIRMCELGRSFPPLNQNFFNQCLFKVTAGKKETARTKFTQDFLDSVKLYYSWRSDTVPLANRLYINRGWHQFTAQQMTTMACNQIVVNFYQRFKKYVRQRFNLTGKDRYSLIENVLAEKYTGDDIRVLELRGWMPRTNKGRVNRQPHLLLPVMYKFLLFIKDFNAENASNPEYRQLRSFSLLPFKSGFTCQHFKMCSVGLRALLQRASFKVPPEGEKWNAVVDDWWEYLFKISKFETKNRKFAGQIVTDGKSVSIVLRKPKKAPRKTPFKPQIGRYEEFWGLDPGRRDLFVAMNQKGDTMSCSTKEYYEDAGFKRSNKKIKRWQSLNSRVLDAICNMPTKKTCLLKDLKKYVIFMISELDYLLEFYVKKPFRKLKFKRYWFMQRKLRQLCQQLTMKAGKRTIVGFGDWSNQDVGGFVKKCPAGPVKKLEHELRKHCVVISIDEHRTSKMHLHLPTKELIDFEEDDFKEHACLSNQFSHRKCRDGNVRRCKVHSVLHCTKLNGGCGMTVNRDKNASKNILLLLFQDLKNKERPKVFCRGKAKNEKKSPLVPLVPLVSL